MGQMLMENTSGLSAVNERSEKSMRDKLAWFLKDFRSMKVLVEEHPWLETMIEAILIEGGAEAKFAARKNNFRRFDKIELLEKSDGYQVSE